MFCFGVGGKDSPNFDVFCLEHLLDRKHPQHFIDYSFAKIFQPKLKTEKNIFFSTFEKNNSITFYKNLQSQP